MSQSREKEYVELEDCYIGAITDKAIQVHHDGDVWWIPKSVIEDADQFKRYEEDASVFVEEWFARKEEII